MKLVVIDALSKLESVSDDKIRDEKYFNGEFHSLGNSSMGQMKKSTIPAMLRYETVILAPLSRRHDTIYISWSSTTRR